MKRYLGLATIVCGLMLIAGPAMADFTDPFYGTGALSGGPDPLGNTWVTTVADDGSVIWGIPGYGNGDVTVPTTFTGVITDFHFSITGGGFTIVGTQNPSTDPFTSETRFQDTTGGGATNWNAVYTPPGPDGIVSVDFAAPGVGSGLVAGDTFFVNIDFMGNPSALLDFTASYSGVSVPEPATLFLLGFGLFGVRLAGRKIKK